MLGSFVSAPDDSGEEVIASLTVTAVPLCSLMMSRATASIYPSIFKNMDAGDVVQYPHFDRCSDTNLATGCELNLKIDCFMLFS